MEPFSARMTGALLLRMLRRGALLPAARFVWRLQDSHAEAVCDFDRF